MKKLAYLLILPALLFLSGCEKTTDNISRITYYATITMNGEQALSIVVGDDYTDEGATALENGVEIPVTVTNNVNPDEPGIYTVDYSATNVDGYTSTVSRVVAVLPEPEAVDAENPAGEYYYIASPSYSTNVIKLAPGFYYAENTYSHLTTIPAYIISTDGVTLTIPEQNTAFGPYYGTGTYDPGSGELTYIINIPDFGIFNRSRFWQRV